MYFLGPQKLELLLGQELSGSGQSVVSLVEETVQIVSVLGLVGMVTLLGL